MANTVGAEVDSRYLCGRPAQRVLGSLRGSASCDQNGIVFAVGSVGPEQMIIGAPPIRVFPQPGIAFRAFNGSRVWIALVKVLGLLRHPQQRRKGFTGSVHIGTMVPVKGRPK